MTMRQPALIDARASRREILRLAAGLAAAPLLGAAHAADVAAPQMRFLGAAEAADALRHAGDTYYADMQLREIRMRMDSPMAGVTLADARIAVRDLDTGAALDFTDEERDAIEHVLARTQPTLAARAPLYARTPWSFIKLADRAEFGFPHTRGPHIVLPAAAAARMTQRSRAAAASGSKAGLAASASLLVHEQTHVLQRASPARFEPLFTEVMGFVHATPGPMTPWLDEQIVRNPDAPDLGWIMPLDKLGGGTGFVLPLLAVKDLDVPRAAANFGADFRTIGVEVARTDAGWTVLQDDDRPRLRDLAQVPGYAARFPFPDEDFHPNEIAAVMLSHWILRDVPYVDRRPLMAACTAWARTALA